MTSTRPLALLLTAAALIVPAAANAASVTPSDMVGNPSCSDLNPSWSDLKVNNVPSDATYSDGTLSATFSNVTGVTTFDWATNHSVDAVMVKAATHTLVYRYDPESYGDTIVSGLGKYAISHVDFCYDAGDYTAPSDPGSSDPGTTDPGSGDPGSGDPGSSDPGTTDPGSSDNSSNNPSDNGGSNTGGSNNNDPQTPAANGQVVAPDASGSSVDPGSQLVLGERIGAVRAKLLAANGCASGPFTARVRGAGIASVVFKVDGKRVATVKRHGMFTIRVNPLRLKIGVHRIVATVRFDPARHAKPRTLRSSFQRCAAHFLAPRFAG